VRCMSSILEYLNFLCLLDQEASQSYKQLGISDEIIHLDILFIITIVINNMY
jgi:hypothetical protein